MRNSDDRQNGLAAYLEAISPKHTPDDSSECIFLGRAYHELAKAMFPEWSGAELTMTLPELLPAAIENHRTILGSSLSDEKTEQAEWYETPRRALLDYAYDLLHKYRPELKPRPRVPGLFGSTISAPPRFTLFEWKAAKEINQAHYDAVRTALHRKRDVDKAIARLCEACVLQTRLRPPEGGAFSDVLPASHWRTENYGERFKTWRMHPEQPFGTSGELHFIFVERTSLAVAISRLKTEGGGGNPVDLTAFVSDQISFLLRTAAKCKVSAENPPSVEAIKAQIIQDWPWVGTPGQTELRYMASLVRNRDARTTPRRRTKTNKAKSAGGKPGPSV